MARIIPGIRLWAVLVVALVIGACGGDSENTSQNADREDTRLKVVTTVSPITSIVENIGGKISAARGSAWRAWCPKA